MALFLCFVLRRRGGGACLRFCCCRGLASMYSSDCAGEMHSHKSLVKYIRSSSEIIMYLPPFSQNAFCATLFRATGQFFACYRKAQPPMGSNTKCWTRAGNHGRNPRRLTNFYAWNMKWRAMRFVAIARPPCYQDNAVFYTWLLAAAKAFSF